MREEAKAGKNREAREKAVAKAIAEMPESDAAIAGRILELVSERASQLMPKTWYSQPAYANTEGKVILFVQSAAKFKTRHCTLGYSEDAQPDDGQMWPTSFAVTRVTPAVVKRIAELILRAASTICQVDMLCPEPPDRLRKAPVADSKGTFSGSNKYHPASAALQLLNTPRQR